MVLVGQLGFDPIMCTQPFSNCCRMQSMCRRDDWMVAGGCRECGEGVNDDPCLPFSLKHMTEPSPLSGLSK